jgi:DNA invertase Pin-like site-specific DNA recombinase
LIVLVERSRLRAVAPRKSAVLCARRIRSDRAERLFRFPTRGRGFSRDGFAPFWAQQFGATLTANLARELPNFALPLGGQFGCPCLSTEPAECHRSGVLSLHKHKLIMALYQIFLDIPALEALPRIDVNMRDMKRAAIYIRVSTTSRARGGEGFEQNPEVQEMPLREMVAHRGWTVARVYSDRMSGAKENRPGLKCLMEDARRGQFDVVLVWRFDRFARSIEQLVTALAEFRALGIDFVSCQEALDTSTPMGKAMFTIIGAMAELERNVIRERVVAGLDYARHHGTKSGNAIGRPKRIFDRTEVVRLRESGLSIERIAREMGIGVGTVARTIQTHRA